jgi:hypothetical protein
MEEEERWGYLVLDVARRMEKSCLVKMIPSKDDEKPVKENTEYCTKGQVI